MKVDVVKVISLLILWLAVGNVTIAQPAAYHQLKAEEFEGMPDLTSSDIVAYTNCFIDFNYRAKSEKGIYRLTYDIKLVFNHDKSWINKRKIYSAKMMEEILDHEQGHYIIAYMEQQELIRTVNKTRFDASYQYEASNIFDRVHEKYKQLSIDYDDDTVHMLNREQQHSWDAYFQKRLTYMPQAEIARN
jgi:hypothetical protein